MPFIVIISMLIAGLIVYFFLNPAEKIEKNELNELDTLDSGYGETIEKFLAESKVNSTVVERFFYLKHKHKLTKIKK